VRKKWRGSLALAATIVLAVTGAGMAWQYWAGGRYVTNVGEQRMVPLDDGSVVTLDTSTQIKQHYTDVVREVELLRGQAIFEVAKDPRRPFMVRIGGGTVRALGTVFDVYKTGDKVTVTLIEGKVEVTPGNPREKSAPGSAGGAPAVAQAHVVLGAGEQVSFATGAKAATMKAPDVVKLTSAEVPHVLAWRAHKLDFSDTPVLEAIAEANRYSREKIVLEAPDLVNARISGTFEAGKNEAFVEGLKAYFHLDVTRAGSDQIVLTRRQD